MRVALKIAYDGRAFYGHQRQPDRRTVEGECIRTLRSTKIIRDPAQAFFRSASRTDRGVSAVGNVIAFDASLGPEAVIGAFNDKAREVWAWAFAVVPDTFHPRHAIERWYRYVLFDEVDEPALRAAARLFVGTHDFQAFCSEALSGPFTVESIAVERKESATFIDVRARSFRRGMVRRMIAGMLAAMRRDAEMSDLEDVLDGGTRDFGSVSPLPLTLMDVLYDIPFRTVLKPGVAEELHRRAREASLQLAHLGFLGEATGATFGP